MTDVVCYYHDPVKAPLLRQAVLPAVAAARAAAPDVRAHLERHWLHGPHLRIRLDGAGADRAAELIAGRLREHLAEHRSAVEIPVAEQLAHARRAATAELLLPPYEPFHPNNSVRVEPTDTTRIHELLGSTALVGLRMTGLRLGLPVVRESLAALAGPAGSGGSGGADSGSARVQLTVTAMAVHASRYPPGLRFGYHSFLSHLEDFLLHSDPDGAVRERFDRIWTANAGPVTEAVARVAEGHPGDRLEAAWQDWTIRMRLAAEEAYDRGDLAAGLSPRYGERAYEIGDPETIRRHNFGEREKFSEYHTRLWQVDIEHPLIKRPLTVYRFGTNVLYQLLAVCDVTPMERYLAASLVARAAQRVTGENWADQLAGMPKAG
jgi:hypothetical protein